MARKKKLTYEQRMLAELQKLPNPIDDKRHDLSVYFVNERARSNQTRFAHIIEARHELKPNDISLIRKRIKTAVFRKDKERSETFNYYIKRFNYKEEYIKISVKIEQSKPHLAIVKTIFITKNVK